MSVFKVISNKILKNVEALIRIVEVAETVKSSRPVVVKGVKINGTSYKITIEKE